MGRCNQGGGVEAGGVQEAPAGGVKGCIDDEAAPGEAVVGRAHDPHAEVMDEDKEEGTGDGLADNTGDADVTESETAPAAADGEAAMDNASAPDADVRDAAIAPAAGAATDAGGDAVVNSETLPEEEGAPAAGGKGVAASERDEVGKEVIKTPCTDRHSSTWQPEDISGSASSLNLPDDADGSEDTAGAGGRESRKRSRVPTVRITTPPSIHPSIHPSINQSINQCVPFCFTLARFLWRVCWRSPWSAPVTRRNTSSSMWCRVCIQVGTGGLIGLPSTS